MNLLNLKRRALVLLALAGALAPFARAAQAPSTTSTAPRDYAFDGKISRPVLENYLSRAITESDLLNGRPGFDEDLRMLRAVGAKFIGRALITWAHEDVLPELFARIPAKIRKIHAADPDMVVQGTAFEIITRRVERVPVPDWVFKEFGLPAQQRNFRYEAMLYADGLFKNHWGPDASVPDMSQLETRLWFFYLAASSINAGIEAIHFGQVALMDARDPGHAHWADLFARVRAYAARHARRHMILCDAHVPHGGVMRGDASLLDFNSFPLRIEEVPDKPLQGVLKMGHVDSLYGRSKGGLTPSGWRCDHLPFLVELDNFGASGHAGEIFGQHWIWGYDEISWFARLSPSERNDWLHYAHRWVREHDPNGHLEMPGSRQLSPAIRTENGRLFWYFANTSSPACPQGFGQEETIKAIWSAEP